MVSTLNVCAQLQYWIWLTLVCVMVSTVDRDSRVEEVTFSLGKTFPIIGARAGMSYKE